MDEITANLAPEEAELVRQEQAKNQQAAGSPPPVDQIVKRGTDGRIKYPEPYQKYGDRFGKSARTIRSWVKLGSKSGELPPLHDPCELVVWIRAHLQHKVPEKIESLAIELQDSPGAIATSSEKTTSTEKNSLSGSDEVLSGEAPKQESIILSLVDVDGDEGLKQARSLTKMSWDELTKALKGGIQSRVERWFKAWREAVQCQRAWEKDINKIMEDRGELLRKSSLVGEIVSLAAAIGRNDMASREELIRRLVSMPEDEMAKLRKDAKARRAFAVASRDESYATLRETEFTAAFVEGATLPEEDAE